MMMRHQMVIFYKDLSIEVQHVKKTLRHSYDYMLE